jgi:hypothetical protein
MRRLLGHDPEIGPPLQELRDRHLLDLAYGLPGERRNL